MLKPKKVHQENNEGSSYRCLDDQDTITVKKKEMRILQTNDQIKKNKEAVKKALFSKDCAVVTEEEEEGEETSSSSCSRSSSNAVTHHEPLHYKQEHQQQQQQTLSNVVLELTKQASRETQTAKQIAEEWGIEPTCVGGMGIALFLPLYWDFHDTTTHESRDEAIDDHEEDGHDDHDIVDDDDDDEPLLHSTFHDHNTECPPILTHQQRKELHNRALPPRVSLMTWTRAYSLARDGDSFHYMMEKCSSYQHTLIAIRTRRGDVLGGYADTPWGQQHTLSSSYGAGSIGSTSTGSMSASASVSSSSGFPSTPSKSTNFFGSGRSFVFSSNPDMDLDARHKHESKFWRKKSQHKKNHASNASAHKDALYIFHWTGENNYNQICDVDRGTFGMGGGGSKSSFGWFVQDNFTIGSTGICDTFSNPPLTKRRRDGLFEIVDMDVYGFQSMALSSSVPSSLASFMSSPSSSSSLLSQQSQVKKSSSITSLSYPSVSSLGSTTSSAAAAAAAATRSSTSPPYLKKSSMGSITSLIE